MNDLSFDACIFDLDGVITKTALVHSSAWKKVFDEYLQERAKRFNEPFIEFKHNPDYLRYVDGKPRYEGVASFLHSRNLDLPWGNPSDHWTKETVCGLGNRKDKAFHDVLEKEGIAIYESSVALIKTLKAKGIRIGVASSSKNCGTVLEKAKLLDLIETNVDGLVAAEMGLRGKPQPDIFITAAKNLSATPFRSIVIEDAQSGVSAGRNGNFGLVLGIAREENHEILKANGADIVVSDLSEISVEILENWFQQGLQEDMYSLSYHNYKPECEKSRETLMAVGNGYFASRGALEETRASDIHYPGTYIAGLYNRLDSKIADKIVSNEDFVNCPNWLSTTFRIDQNDWINLDEVEVISITRRLCFQTGILEKTLKIKDKTGKISEINALRTVSMENPHLALLVYTIRPINYSGKITFRSGLEGNIINDGVPRYRELNQAHLVPLDQGKKDDFIYLTVETKQSKIRITEAAKFFRISGENRSAFSYDIVNEDKGHITVLITEEAQKGSLVGIEKFVAIYTSKETNKPLEKVAQDFSMLGNLSLFLKKSEEQWKMIWDKIDIQLTGDRLSQKLLRLNIYHSILTASPHSIGLDVGLPARGLHGEAYRGHIFWDEIFILPFYYLHFPKIAKSLLLYRYCRLDKARQYAAEHGYLGAMFPWQSGSEGSEETQTLHLNPISGEWGPDYSSLQRHVSLAIAYNIWNYYHITEDSAFLAEYGLEMLIEIARFWVSKASKNQQGFDIQGVMGPDEFHEKYPEAQEGGIANNTYTNVMVSWLLQTVVQLSERFQSSISKKNLSNDEKITWIEIAKNLKIEFSDDGIIAQYQGYFDLEELDWEAYRRIYGNIYRMDRILKAEGKSPDEYKVSKQADTLMLFYLFPIETVSDLLKNMGYKPVKNYILKNFNYYFQRTSHGSTLSRMVHGGLANTIGKEDIAWEFYQNALGSDYFDSQGGTTAEGIHLGVMTGTVLQTMNTFAGINIQHDILHIDPKLPLGWEFLRFSISFKGKTYIFEVYPDRIKIKISDIETPVLLLICKKERFLTNSDWHIFEYIQ